MHEFKPGTEVVLVDVGGNYPGQHGRRGTVVDTSSLWPIVEWDDGERAKCTIPGLLSEVVDPDDAEALRAKLLAAGWAWEQSEYYPEVGTWRDLEGRGWSCHELTHGVSARLVADYLHAEVCTVDGCDTLAPAGTCFTCSYWLGHARRAVDPPEWRFVAEFRGERNHYIALPGGGDEHSGHGGREFIATWPDGTQRRTRNLWAQGVIPERFYYLFPVTGTLEAARADTTPSTLLDVLSGAIEAARAERKATALHLDA